MDLALIAPGRLQRTAQTWKETVGAAADPPGAHRLLHYFRDAAGNAAEAARLLTDLFAGREEPGLAGRRLRDLEHRGDTITHDVFTALSRNLIAPLSYVDIRALTRELDNFIDDIDAIGQRLILYQLLPAPEPALRLVSNIHARAEVLVAAISLLERGSTATNWSAMSASCIVWNTRWTTN